MIKDLKKSKMFENSFLKNEILNFEIWFENRNNQYELTNYKLVRLYNLKSPTAWGLIPKSGIRMIKNSILSKRVFRTRAKLAFFVFFWLAKITMSHWDFLLLSWVLLKLGFHPPPREFERKISGKFLSWVSYASFLADICDFLRIGFF